MRQISHLSQRTKHYGELTDILPVMTPKRIERFWSKIDRSAGTDACHPWRGGCNQPGYGLVQGSVDYQGYSFLAHRVAWALSRVDEPGERIVRHRCDNPRCCNPRHLLTGTHADNTRDMLDRGRQRTVAGQSWVHAKHAGMPQEAWRLRYHERMPMGEIARQLGVHPQTVARWTRPG